MDDEAVIRRSIRACLEDYDYRVLEAANEAIGIDLFERERIDLLLVDLRMPEMSGLQVLSHIRRTMPDLPVIVVSGAGVISDVVEALRLGAWDYLMKPINDLSILKHAIEQGLDRARLIEEKRRYQSGLEEIISRKTRALTELNFRLRDVVETTRTLLGCGDLDDSGAMILKEFARLVDAGGGSIYEVRAQICLKLTVADTGIGMSPEIVARIFDPYFTTKQ